MCTQDQGPISYTIGFTASATTYSQTDTNIPWDGDGNTATVSYTAGSVRPELLWVMSLAGPASPA